MDRKHEIYEGEDMHEKVYGLVFHTGLCWVSGKL